MPYLIKHAAFWNRNRRRFQILEERRTNQSQEAAVHHRKRQRSAAGGVLKVLLTLILVGCCTLLMLFGIFMKYVNTSLLPTLDVNADDYTMAQSSVVYYQDKDSGQWVEYQKVHGQENRVLVDIGDMSPYLWQAAVSIEDERFFSHHGVDWKRTLGATVLTLVGSNDSYGGSTITQQMLKNLTGENQNTINRKVKEIFRALEFEKDNTKSQILELYLNMIYLGSGCNGVETAAEYYFGKSAKDLTAAESACIIAITNNPSLYNPKYDRTYTRKDGTTVTPRELNKGRQELILDKMSKVINPDTGKPYLTEEECEAAKAEPLNFTDTSGDADSSGKQTDGIEINNWFVEQLIKDVTSDLADAKSISYEAAQRLVNNSGYQIYCTMDPDIQKIAEDVYADTSNLNIHSAKGHQLQSGITIMDPYTGNVVAMVGAVGEKTQNLVDNYAVQKHQVGSSIKPLTVYSAALDAGAVTPATTFDNYPVHLLNGNPWPKNSPNTYTGWTMIGEGVRRSINTIAVQTLEALGVADSYAYATEKLGLSLVPEDMGVAPLAMGGLTYGLSTVEMAAAFSSFANSGVYNSPKMYTEVRDSSGEVVLKNEGETHAAMKETTAYFMNQMLTSVVNAGTGTSAKFSGMTIAGKTGTTNDSRVRYFVGYTPYYCAAVWTGYPSTEKISASGNPAISMWKPIMQKIHENLENKSFPTPSSGLEQVTVCADSGKLVTDACLSDIRGSRAVTVTVAAGTAPTERCDKHVLVDYCTEGKCLATDSCPADHVKQVGVLDFERTDYFNGGSRILATDSAKNPDSMFHLIEMKRAIGLEPTPTAGGGETYPEVIGCPVHAGMTPEEPDNSGGEADDPNDPNYNPPSDNNGGNGGDQPAEPSEPVTPAEPSEPDDPSGGFGDAGIWAASVFSGN